MTKITNEELFKIFGGINISGTLFNALIKAGTTILDAGRALGSAIRRLSLKKICPVK